MNKLVFFILLSSILLVSCNHDIDYTSSPTIAFPLKSGNYWIYRTTITAADGVVNIFPYLDSVWIEKDTLINNKRYWKETGTLRGTIYLRDSGNCLLMKEYTYEQIIFSTSRDTLNKNLPIYKVMTNLNEVTKVPAGDYTTSNCRTLIRKDRSGQGHSDLPSFDAKFYTSEQYICSPKVGLVKYVSYYIGDKIEYELVRYKLY